MAHELFFLQMKCYGGPLARECNGMSHMISGLRLFALAVLVAGPLAGCAIDRPLERPAVGPALIGKSRQEIVKCAGPPSRETRTADGAVLKYYKEIPMLDESEVSSKGSRPRVHGGCWATIGISGDRVVGVEFDSVPVSGQADLYCEEIFETCVTPASPS